MRPWRIDRSGTTEDRTVALEWAATWPVIDYVHEREAAGGDFIDHEAGRHAVALPIPWDTLRRPRPQPGQRRRKVAQIAQMRPTSRQRMQRLADELAAEGLVEFVDNPRHLRSKLVRLTRKGDARYRELHTLF